MKIFRLPTAIELLEDQLADTQRKLVEAQLSLEAAAATVDLFKRREARILQDLAQRKAREQAVDR